jgi:hypothetical protein
VHVDGLLFVDNVLSTNMKITASPYFLAVWTRGLIAAVLSGLLWGAVWWARMLP